MYSSHLGFRVNTVEKGERMRAWHRSIRRQVIKQLHFLFRFTYPDLVDRFSCVLYIIRIDTETCVKQYCHMSVY